MHTFDIDLSPRDIQSLNSSDAIAAFFARLGYKTDARTNQTAGNLGIAPDGSTDRPIKKIELIANQEGLLQVYLFELQSVTVAHTRALSRVFRNRAGNYLLILTSDYDRLDFVFLERELPKPTGAESTIVEKQSGIRPRVLTVDRRNPTSVQLRVLRRFTWTESDPFYQYEKLKAAYALADWSEEYFNNRALFSDYYLTKRLPEEFSIWTEDPKPAYRQLRELYQSTASRFSAKDKKFLYQELVGPVLQALGFEGRPGKIGQNVSAEPRYRLYSKESKDSLLAFCQVYPWDRSLDGKDDRRDSETAEENPGAVVVSLLERGESPWVVVTNGRLWRLYAKRTHARATNYYEIDLDEVLSQSGPHAPEISDSFRYFWLLFRSQAFELRDEDREGKKVSLSLLDRLILESEVYAKELGERLKDRIFDEIFPHLAEGFIHFIRERDGAHAAISQETLDTIYHGTLTLLYRLLFLLYAESRDLLPAKEVRGYHEASLSKLKAEIKEAAGAIEDTVEGTLKKFYREDKYALYERLGEVFRIVDKGNAALNVPVYNGGLFLSDPEDNDETPEADAARFLNSTKIPDRFLSRAIDLLARDVDRKRHDLVFIDFKSLGVRQLGSIYEGLLEFRLRIAPHKLGVVKEKSREVYVDFSKLEKKDQERAERQKRFKSKGQVYLENDKHERKATGSYYTPDHIVKYIVEHAVGPVLKEKFEAMRPKLREAQQKHRAFFERQEALRKQGLRPEPESKAEFIGQEIVDELFNIKILDPAMGSGHFLVEAVDYTTDKTLDFLNAFPWNPVIAHLARMRDTILQEMDEQGITIDPKRLTDVNLLKRHVLKRCIYGVDINPMAVELAKVSLWLDCFTLGAPLSFLDHHLRCGNSLIGVTVDEVNESIQSGQLSLLSGTRFEGMKQAVAGMIRIGELSDVTSAQVSESRREYLRASEAMKPAKRLLDVYASQWFGNTPSVAGRGKKKSEHNRALEFLRDAVSERWAQTGDPSFTSKEWREAVAIAIQAAHEKRFFHWELEFPEVFYGPRPGTTQAIERMKGAGFDAVIGNPPYDVLASEELGYDVSDDLHFYEAQPIYEPAIRGKKNLYKLFICRAVAEADRTGACSFIVPMPLLGDDQAAGVRKMLLEEISLIIIEAFPQKDDPHNRVFPEAKLATTVFVTRKQTSKTTFTVRTHPGRYIEIDSPALRLSASQVLAFDPENGAIPSCTQRDWDIAVSVLCRQGISRFGQMTKSFQGEVNETNEDARGALVNTASSPLVLRGSNICLYAVRKASQGEDVHLSVKNFLASKDKDSKAFAYERERVGFQRSSPQNNFRRIIASRIPKDSFCFDTVSYVTDESSPIDLDLLIAFLNSKLLDWYFRLGSTNSKVNEYQFNALPILTINSAASKVDWHPVFERHDWTNMADLLCKACTPPGTMPKPVADALAEMSRRIQEIEAKRVLKNRSERSRLDPESQPIQDAIDAVLFRCYGLSEDEAKYVEKRLTEML